MTPERPQYADLDHLPTPMYDFRRTTVLQYASAPTDDAESNPAAKYMDTGKEPFLLRLEAEELGLHPLIPVYDCTLKTDSEGRYGLVLASKTVYVSGSTILVWR